MKGLFLFCITLLLLITGTYSDGFCQSWPAPVLPDTSSLGQYSSRTLNLLQSSTPGKRNQVRILVYGQSISEQEWWLEVKQTVGKRFPFADLVMENKAIGGFSTQYLYKTVEMDVSAFYPDLVLLHIYGNNKDYETVLRTIRSRTASEIAIMTDHYIGENKWSDTMSYHILPALADKYKCDIINIRDPWKAYLKDNNLEPSTLLRDGIHLNDYGNFLMAELVKPLFCFKSRFPADPFGLLTIINPDTDHNISGDTLCVPFQGNRVDLIYNTAGSFSGDSVRILLDGKLPSAFGGCYYMTRPYNSRGDTWPWTLPAMITVDHTSHWINEEWTCIFTKAVPPFSDFSFRIEGSLTGKDGHGRGSKDFISKSGRVIIRGNDGESGGDWHLNRSYKVLKTIVHTGDSVKWKTYSIATDVFVPEGKSRQSDQHSEILFQGVMNSDHMLKIVSEEREFFPFLALKVYRPYWNR